MYEVKLSAKRNKINIAAALMLLFFLALSAAFGESLSPEIGQDVVDTSAEASEQDVANADSSGNMVSLSAEPSSCGGGASSLVSDFGGSTPFSGATENSISCPELVSCTNDEDCWNACRAAMYHCRPTGYCVFFN